MTPAEIDDVQLKQALTHKLLQFLESGVASSPAELVRRAPPSWSGVEVAPASSQPMTPKENYISACRSVVAVGKLYQCRNCQKRHASIASGFVIGRSGLVITNQHVVDDPDKEALGIMTLNGTVHAVQSVLQVDRHSDLAALQVRADDLVPLSLGEEPPVGATVYVLSHPAGRLFTFTSGIVSRYSSHRGDQGKVHRSMTVTADFGRGSSGAPVLDSHGAVVGVARQTKSIYHPADGDSPRRLQMVLKHCVPSGALREFGLRPTPR